MYMIPHDDPHCLWRPIAPNMQRRCDWHDYRSRCIYMITMRSSREYGALSVISRAGCGREGFVKSASISSSKGSAEVECTPVGMAIAKEFNKIGEICPDLKITNRVFMPDHVHFLLYATCCLEETISFYISKLKGRCSRSVWEMFEDIRSGKGKIPVFQPGFNDKILFQKGQLQNFIHYIDDNPRRLLVARECPEFFRNRHKLRLGMSLHDAYGNLDLINHPVKTWVVVRSHYTEVESENYYRHWREVARQGGVLIGPFISEAEKKIKWGALKAGAKVIQIKPQGFHERYKPLEADMEYCAKGQLLEIGFKEYSTRPLPYTRAQCLAMNDFSKYVASLTADKIHYV